MLKMSDLARTKIKEVIENYKKPVIGIRAMAQSRSPFQVSYGLVFVDEKNVHENDKILKIDDVNVYIDPEQINHFDGVTLDYEDGLSGTGFKFIDLPRVPKKYKGTIRCLMNSQDAPECFACEKASITDVLIAKSYQCTI